MTSTISLFPADAILADEWHDHEGHSYRFYEDNLATAVSAARRCADQGALLVSLNSHQEADFVARTVLRMSVMSVFIGGTDEGSGREGRLNASKYRDVVQRFVTTFR